MRAILTHERRGEAAAARGPAASVELDLAEIRRRLAAAEVALINDVVMKQRRRMHELDARREPHMAGALIAGQLGGGDGQHRPEALAA